MKFSRYILRYSCLCLLGTGAVFAEYSGTDPEIEKLKEDLRTLQGEVNEISEATKNLETKTVGLENDVKEQGESISSATQLAAENQKEIGSLKASQSTGTPVTSSADQQKIDEKQNLDIAKLRADVDRNLAEINKLSAKLDKQNKDQLVGTIGTVAGAGFGALATFAANKQSSNQPTNQNSAATMSTLEIMAQNGQGPVSKNLTTDEVRSRIINGSSTEDITRDMTSEERFQFELIERSIRNGKSDQEIQAELEALRKKVADREAQEIRAELEKSKFQRINFFGLNPAFSSTKLASTVVNIYELSLNSAEAPKANQILVGNINSIDQEVIDVIHNMVLNGATIRDIFEFVGFHTNGNPMKIVSAEPKSSKLESMLAELQSQNQNQIEKTTDSNFAGSQSSLYPNLQNGSQEFQSGLFQQNNAQGNVDNQQTPQQNTWQNQQNMIQQNGINQQVQGTNVQQSNVQQSNAQGNVNNQQTQQQSTWQGQQNMVQQNGMNQQVQGTNVQQINAQGNANNQQQSTWQNPQNVVQQNGMTQQVQGTNVQQNNAQGNVNNQQTQQQSAWQNQRNMVQQNGMNQQVQGTNIQQTNVQGNANNQQTQQQNTWQNQQNMVQQNGMTQQMHGTNVLQTNALDNVNTPQTQQQSTWQNQRNMVQQNGMNQQVQGTNIQQTNVQGNANTPQTQQQSTWQNQRNMVQQNGMNQQMQGSNIQQANAQSNVNNQQSQQQSTWQGQQNMVQQNGMNQQVQGTNVQQTNAQGNVNNPQAQQQSTWQGQQNMVQQNGVNQQMHGTNIQQANVQGNVNNQQSQQQGNWQGQQNIVQQNGMNQQVQGTNVQQNNAQGNVNNLRGQLVNASQGVLNASQTQIGMQNLDELDMTLMDISNNAYYDVNRSKFLKIAKESTKYPKKVISFQPLDKKSQNLLGSALLGKSSSATNS